MKIVELATSLNDVEEELNELELDMFASKEEIKKKENEKKKLLDELLFYSEFEELYEFNKENDLDSSLLYPYKEFYNEEGKKEFACKSSEEYKEDVDKYLEDLLEAFNEGKIDEKQYKEFKKDAIKLANKQMERIKEEEKEKTNDIDINDEYNEILDNIEETKKAFIINQVGEEYYGGLQVHYKNMQEIDKKILLRKTHEGLCKEMGIASDLDFTKYDLSTDNTVSKDGYCIRTKDLNNMPYPLDTIILEQSYKLHIKEILNNNDKYPPLIQEKLTKMLVESLDKQKALIFEQAKKKKLDLYGE